MVFMYVFVFDVIDGGLRRESGLFRRIEIRGDGCYVSYRSGGHREHGARARWKGVLTYC